MAERDAAEIRTEKPADLVREQREAEQRGHITDAEELAHDGGGRRHGCEPGETQTHGKRIERPLGLRRHQVPTDQQRARAVHDGENVFAAEARGARARDEAADDVGETDQGQRPARHCRRQATEIHFAWQVGHKKGNVKAAGKEPSVQEQIAAIPHRVAKRLPW